VVCGADLRRRVARAWGRVVLLLGAERLRVEEMALCISVVLGPLLGCGMGDLGLAFWVGEDVAVMFEFIVLVVVGGVRRMPWDKSRG
jgi:hypothetical protein